MRFQLLGQLVVSAENGEIDLGAPKQRSVLAVLLLNANDIVPTDRIIDLVWGESAPRTAEHSVQIYVSELRKALSNGAAGDLIDTRPPGYVINVAPDAVDTLLFERLVRDGLSAVRAGDTAAAKASLGSAMDVWGGDPLADFAYEDFAQGYIRSLTELRSDALEALAGIALASGETASARELAKQAIEADPLREEPRRVMMLALYRSGRQVEALRHFADYRRGLVEELGIEPSENLRQLEERILLADPSLDLREGVTPSGNPYRGLRPFSEADADIYFGRESLVEEVHNRLVEASGFVSIVGPSGSGKSSAARAGLVPLLREQGETVVVFQPGSRPLWELAGAMDQAGFGSRATLLRRFERSPAALAEIVDRPVVVIIDQFEELFTLSEADTATRFGELLAVAVRDEVAPLQVIVTLRADYYDKPLSIPPLAGVFSDSVVSVKPMTPAEIERAVVEPAAAAGATVERGLLAQLVADMGDEPGALPLLQFTLFELFEASPVSLTLDAYAKLGGLHGALTGGADELLDQLDEEESDLAEQLMMRMIQKGRATSTSRPVPVRDLLDMNVDPEALQAVLEAFGTRRLITFDRDSAGAAVIEMAHEFLITEWPQMEHWIGLHSEDLDRLDALDVAADEWANAGKSEDYLLRGTRLEGFDTWRSLTTLRLTSLESGFIDASIEMRNRDQQVRAEQARKEAALSRRARRRLWYFGGAVAALAAAVTVLVMTLLPEPPPDFVAWHDGRGDGSFSDLIGSGIDQAVAQHGLDVIELEGDSPSHFEEIARLVERGVPLVMLLNSDLFQPPFNDGLVAMIEANPDTQFLIIDCGYIYDPGEEDELFGTWPENAVCVASANEQLGFLAGVVAALATETGTVGFVGGMDIPIVANFQAGFEQGVSFVSPEVAIEQIYLTGGFDFSGFTSWSMGFAAGDFLHRRGADVIFHAAGGSGWGTHFYAVDNLRTNSSPLRTIGVDVDQASAAAALQFDEDDIAALQEVILTSVAKRLDLGISASITNWVETGRASNELLTLESGGLVYATTGGHVTPWTEEIDAAIEAVVSGDVIVDPWNFEPHRYLLDQIP